MIHHGLRLTAVPLATVPGIEARALRPLGVGEVLDVAINLYFRNPGRLLGIAAAIVLPVTAVIFILDALALQEVEAFSENAALYQVGDTVRVLDESRFVLLQVIKTLVYVAGYLLVTGAVFKAVSDAYLGHTPDGRASIGFAAGRMHSLLWLSILYVVIVGIGLLALIVPGIYLLVMFSVSVPVLLVENQRGSKALGRSFDLVRRNWWRTLGALLVGFIFIALFAFLVGLISSAADSVAEDSVYAWALIYDLLDGVSTIITAPLQAAIITVIYYDLRVRKEGFDVALMSAALGTPGGPQDVPAGGTHTDTDAAPAGSQPAGEEPGTALGQPGSSEPR